MKKRIYKSIEIDIDALNKNENNSRVHSDNQIKEIAESIKEFGFTNPVLIDENNTLIAGHGRLDAARKLNLKTISAVIVSGLTEPQKRALMIVDNKLALNASWDNDVLSKEVSYLTDNQFDIGLLGFGEDELAELTMDFRPDNEPLPSLDKLSAKMVTCPHCKKEFDLNEQ